MDSRNCIYEVSIIHKSSQFEGKYQNITTDWALKLNLPIFNDEKFCIVFIFLLFCNLYPHFVADISDHFFFSAWLLYVLLMDCLLTFKSCAITLRWVTSHIQYEGVIMRENVTYIRWWRHSTIVLIELRAHGVGTFVSYVIIKTVIFTCLKIGKSCTKESFTTRYFQHFIFCSTVVSVRRQFHVGEMYVPSCRPSVMWIQAGVFY